VENAPTPFDYAKGAAYATYEPRLTAPISLFTNARINAQSSLALSDLFTGRALHNVDLLLEAFQAEAESTRRALRLTLTAASGQMSRMVFAITGRGKRSGAAGGRVEVGSWVIGYWRPQLHFEVNAWNTFRGRARKLQSALGEAASSPRALLSTDGRAVASGHATASIQLGDARAQLAALPPDCAQLILADPPHVDRVPYLELSAMWNALLSNSAPFEREIVVSNAAQRGKTVDAYITDMAEVFNAAARVIRPLGYLALFFNSTDDKEWAALRQATEAAPLTYLGSWPMAYSARSVVQDNRAQALKEDLILLFAKDPTGRLRVPQPLSRLIGWLPPPFPAGPRR
jgi:hypothetical protein